MTEANAAGLVMGGVCHGPLGIQSTPHHLERELRGADFESQTRRRDPLANHWVVDGNIVTGQNQNAGPMVAREMMQLLVSQRTASFS